MIDFIEEEEPPLGSPAWMATFADLMSLLMCFFVLLLSFSELDVQKYKLVAGSMKNAFGIQTEIVTDDNPVGTAQFENPLEQPETETETDPEAKQRQFMMDRIQELVAETREDVETLEETLKLEIGKGEIDLVAGFRNITIRINEQGSFSSGSAELNPVFEPVLAKLRDTLITVEGTIAVEGHTDNIDIKTAQFASNWALSSARALSVAHALLRDSVLENSRFMVVGLSDTRSLDENTSADGRARNRRVEIVIRQSVEDEVADAYKTLDAPEASGSDTTVTTTNKTLAQLESGNAINRKEILALN